MTNIVSMRKLFCPLSRVEVEDRNRIDSNVYYAIRYGNGDGGDQPSTSRGAKLATDGVRARFPKFRLIRKLFEFQRPLVPSGFILSQFGTSKTHPAIPCSQFSSSRSRQAMHKTPILKRRFRDFDERARHSTVVQTERNSDSNLFKATYSKPGLKK